MLPAPPPRQPSQKRPAVQWDMGGLLDTEHARMKSMSPQAGISRLSVLSGRWRTRHRLIDGRVQSLPIGGHRLIVEIKSLGEPNVTHWNRVIGANQSRHFSNPSWGLLAPLKRTNVL